MLEVKVRDARGRTVKHRRDHDVDRRDQLSPEGRAFVSDVPEAAPWARLLVSTLTTRYARTTLLLPGDDTRVTIDVDLQWEGADGGDAALPGLVIIETKSPGPPSAVDRELWRAGVRPTTISKYCTGLAAVTPGLPANKWNRVLRRHFGWQPDR